MNDEGVNGMRMTGHTVLITGGASGIGFAVAKKLVRMSNKVIIIGRDASKLEAARRAIPELVAFACDISVEEQRLSLAAWLKEEHPELSVLINNAGIQYHARFDQDPPSLDAIHQELEINFVAVVRLCSLLIPMLSLRSEAAIINLSSGLAIAPKSGAAIYCATKAAVSTFTRSLRYQLEQSSIHVFDVLPPLVDTDMVRGRGKGKISADAFADQMIAGVVRGRLVLHVGKTKLLYYLHRFMPKVAYRIMKHGL